MRKYLLLSICLLTLPLTLLAQPALTVHGQIHNGTAGASQPANLPVTLHVFTGETEHATYTTTADAQGAFQFEPFDTGPEQHLVARTTYQQVDYYSAVCSPNPEQTHLSLPITVYESTTQASTVAIDRHTLIIEPAINEPLLHVADHYQVSNLGDRTYIGPASGAGQRVTLTGTLPAAARQPSGDDPTLRVAGGGFTIRTPIRPGEQSTQALIQYHLPYTANLPVNYQSNLPISQTLLIIAETAYLAPAGAAFSAPGHFTTSLGAGLSYTAGPLTAHQPLSFTLEPQSSPMQRAPWLEAGIGLAALLLALAGAYLLLRRPRSRLRN